MMSGFLARGLTQRSRYCGGHLGEHMEDYLDDLMSERARRTASRHLVCCGICAQEHQLARELRHRLRAPITAQPDGLTAGLLALGTSSVAEASSRADTACDSVDRADGRRIQQRAMPSTCRVSVLTASAPAQYSRRQRGPVVGVMALVAVVSVAGGAVWATPQRNAPSEPREVRMARQAAGSADQVTAISVESPPVVRSACP